MSKKLAAKNAMIELPLTSKPTALPELSAGSPPRTRTAVGGMAQFVTTQSPVHREVEELRKTVKLFDGAHVVRAIDPITIVPSEWANRHKDTFSSQDFAELKREIRESGGNIQPIKIRPVPNSESEKKRATQFEIVYGHRRHHACLELGIAVNALIEVVDDQKLFEQMERENRGRKNLSPWEQGRMYQIAIEKGLYPSQRKLSEAVGVDVSLISKSIALARLPSTVIEAFTSPLDVQFRWAQPLTEEAQKNPEQIIAIAKQIIIEARTTKFTAADVFTRLIGRSVAKDVDEALSELQEESEPKSQEDLNFFVNERGDLVITIKTGIINVDHQATLRTLLEKFLESGI